MNAITHLVPASEHALRRITPLADRWGRVTPGGDIDEKPEIRWVAPTSLWVDETYQRSISDKGARLIREIVRAWDWSSFKLPVCVETKQGLICIDGQHTATGAATRGVPSIPVLVVAAGLVKDQAKAFIGHNTRRVGITKPQLFHAALAAGDEDAVTAQNVCDRARVRIILSPRAQYNPRETMAVTVIVALAKKHGAMVARQILECLADANLAPIKALHIRAAELLLRDEAYANDRIQLDQLTFTIVKEREAEYIAGQIAAAKGVPLFKALAIHWNKWRARPKKPALADGMIG